jgi:hypothetical protein
LAFTEAHGKKAALPAISPTIAASNHTAAPGAAINLSALKN